MKRSRLESEARDFLDQKRIAPAGVSRSEEQPANLICRKLRDSGHVAGRLPLAAALLLAAALAACASTEPQVPPEQVERAQQKLQPFKERLQGALMTALEEGPENAIAVCRERAPEIAESLSIDGVEMGRTSHRLRNPANVAPTWVEPLLEKALREPRSYEPLAVFLEDSRVGYVEPIEAAAMCMSCHGPAVDPGLLAEIRSLYPEDAATGFRTGDLRGVFWIALPSSG